MLVLLRRDGDTIVINGNITIRLLQSKTGRARIGVEAPKNIRVARGEQLEASDHSEEDVRNGESQSTPTR